MCVLLMLETPCVAPLFPQSISFSCSPFFLSFAWFFFISFLPRFLFLNRVCSVCLSNWQGCSHKHCSSYWFSFAIFLDLSLYTLLTTTVFAPKSRFTSWNSLDFKISILFTLGFLDFNHSWSKSLLSSFFINYNPIQCGFFS